jgi:hypothetical protein
MADERRGMSFWDWLSENPITAVVILLAILSGVALVFGYREGFISVFSGLFGWIKGDDAENKRKLVETRKRTDDQFNVTTSMIDANRQQRILDDQEVNASEESAKAECDDMDIDELVDIGNSMLADHSAK